MATLADPVKVRVKWSAEKLANLPAAGSYSTVARFSEDRDWPQGETWSIVLRLPSPGEMRDGPFEAEARFLAPEAPADRLKSGSAFDLFEGRVRTATVLVL